MKIGIVALADFDVVTSAVRRVHALGKGMAALDHEVHIFIPQRFRPGPLMEEIDGLTVHWGVTTTYETWNSLATRLQARWATIRLVDNLARNGLDWLVLYNLGLEGLPLLMAARRHGARVAVEYCDARVLPEHPRIEDRTRFLWHSLADTLVPRCTDLNIAISRFLKQWLLTKAPCTPTLIVPPLVDTDMFQVRPQEAQNFRKKWQLGNTPVIAYLGSYLTVEGVANLLKSAGDLAVAGEQFKLVISGDAAPRHDCDDVPYMVKEMGLDRYVVQTGWLHTGEVIACMSAADILVVPKTDDVANRAGLATKMAEYLSMGQAVVATRVGDVSLYLHDGMDSLLCAPCNQPELTNALCRLINNPAERSKLGKNARQTALNHFDYRSAGRQICAVMRQVQFGSI